MQLHRRVGPVEAVVQERPQRGQRAVLEGRQHEGEGLFGKAGRESQRAQRLAQAQAASEGARQERRQRTGHVLVQADQGEVGAVEGERPGVVVFVDDIVVPVVEPRARPFVHETLSRPRRERPRPPGFLPHDLHNRGYDVGVGPQPVAVIGGKGRAEGAPGSFFLDADHVHGVVQVAVLDHVRPVQQLTVARRSLFALFAPRTGIALRTCGTPLALQALFALRTGITLRTRGALRSGHAWLALHALHALRTLRTRCAVFARAARGTDGTLLARAGDRQGHRRREHYPEHVCRPDFGNQGSNRSIWTW